MIGEPDCPGVVDVRVDVAVVGEVRWDTVMRAIPCGFGLCGHATCFGASTTTPGSEVVAPSNGVAACDIVAPLRPYRSSANDEIATARLATKSDENLIATSSRIRDGTFHPGRQDITFPGELGHSNFNLSHEGSKQVSARAS
jgi:hypothetical protein